MKKAIIVKSQDSEIFLDFIYGEVKALEFEYHFKLLGVGVAEHILRITLGWNEYTFTDVISNSRL